LVILYRYGSDPKRRPEDEFSGQGGVLGVGRWHIKGQRVVYAANSEPLALLEKVVHRALSTLSVYPLYFADVPDDLIDDLPVSKLPRDWKSIYPPASTMLLGAEWLKSEKHAVLLLPSVLISGRDRSRNCIINPAHPEIGRAGFTGPEIIPFDPRFPV
jgi:RES domain-containing protein